MKLSCCTKCWCAEKGIKAVGSGWGHTSSFIFIVFKYVANQKWSPAFWGRLTMDSGWRGDREVPQSILKAWVWVIWRCWWGRRGYKVGERNPLCKWVQAHGVKVAGSQSLGVIGTGVESLGQLIQGAVEGGFEYTGCPHTRWQTEGVDDLLWASIWWQLTSEEKRQKAFLGSKLINLGVQLTNLCRCNKAHWKVWVTSG